MTLTICIALFLTLYLCQLLLDLWLLRLDLGHMQRYRAEPPMPFRDFITPERYQQSIAYTTAYHRLSAIVTIIDAAIFLIFVYSGLLNWLDLELRRHIAAEIQRGVALFLVLFGLSHLMGIPCSLYETFVIEAKFGFNRQTWKLWLKDEFRGLLVSLAILVPLSFAVLYLMQSLGVWWWLYTWAVMFAFGFTLAKLYPILIAPLFNKFTALPEGELRAALEQLTHQVNFPIANIYVMDASIRTSHPNAYFTGLGKTKRLVLFDSLVHGFSPQEIAAVVAHEIGHDRHRHIWKSLAISQSVSLLFFYLLSLCLSSPYLYQIFLIEHYPATYMGMILLSILISTALAFLAPLFNWASWQFETQADRYAYDTITEKLALKTMLVKLTEKSLSNLTPHPLYARFNYSHPPVFQRLQALGLDH